MFKRIILDKKFNTLFFFLALTFLAGIFRFYNLNWDMGNYFHPDERNIANAVSQIHFFSQLNPHFFAYGGFSIYLYRLAGDSLSFITKNAGWTTNWANINLIGRFFSALFSTLTIIPLYFLAKKISDKKTAFLSIILYAFTVTSIQTAHFGVTESLITLIGVLLCLLSILFLEKSRWLITLILGIIFGIGIASKTSAIIFIVMPILAYLLTTIGKKHEFKKIILHIIAFLLISFTVFAIFSPFTFLDFGKFMESMVYESGVATGSLPVVYTLQFDHTIPYLFQIYNFFWQIGLAAIFCIFGFVFVIFEALQKRDKQLLVFLVLPLIYFLYVGSWHTKFVRYMIPIIPFLLVSAAILLMRIRLKLKLLGNLLIFGTVTATVVWALAFFSIYTRPQTRILASEWIYQTIPYGTKILNEQWDDGLPIPIAEFSPSQYQITSLAMYDADNAAKVEYLAANLSSSSYLIFNSRRLYGTLIHLTDKYPITSKYYKLLFAGKLGYREVAQFTSYPAIFGLTINDDASEETFQVYDHPKVIIFKNIGHFNAQQLTQILNKE
ncbi:MAG: glycosyltransferase family 39 protein [Candidatus Levyibacteriota bacterium]